MSIFGVLFLLDDQREAQSIEKILSLKWINMRQASPYENVRDSSFAFSVGCVSLALYLGAVFNFRPSNFGN